MVLRKLSQGFKITMALMLSVLSSGILQTAPAYATNHEAKAAVCKYVGKPGSERLQTGNNPVVVDRTEEMVVGGYFQDGQNQSYVLAFLNVGDPEPSVTGCPGYVAEDQEIPVPTVAVTDDCGPDNDVYVDFSSDQYTIVRNADRSITLTANEGFVFPGNQTTATLPAPVDNDAACPVVPTLVQLPTPGVTDDCGPNNDVYVAFSAPNSEYTITRNADRSITLTANTGFVFPGNQTTATLPAPVDNDAACQQQAIDLCSNIAGDQTTLPDYVTVRGNDRCVVTICHRTNSVTHPYVVETPDANAVDGDTGNNTGQGDHYAEHQGPVFDPNTVYPTPHNGDQWGDIIPAVPGLTPGLNWDANGQATYNNGCTPTQAGTPNVTATTICVPNGVKVTLTNTGNADDNVTINGTPYPVPASDSIEVTLPFDIGTPFTTVVTVTINSVTSTQTVNCAPGQGGGQTLGSTTTTPQTLGTTTELPAALPATGGEQNPMLIVLASLMAYGVAYFLQGRRQLNQNRA